MVESVVFFDFGGTLVTLPPLLNEPWRVWSQVAKSFELDIPDSRIQHVNEEADRRFEGQIYAYHGRTVEFWRLRDTWVTDRLGIETRKEDFFDTVQTIFGDPSLVELYPETMEVLEKLRSMGFPMGIVSNFTDALRDVLEYHGLSGFFDTVTYSQEVGAEKPDQRVFSLALRRARQCPAEAVHVGDSWQSDYEGARAAGLRAIWLNREGVMPHGPCELIRDLRDLPPKLTR